MDDEGRTTVNLRLSNLDGGDLVPIDRRVFFWDPYNAKSGSEYRQEVTIVPDQELVLRSIQSRNRMGEVYIHRATIGERVIFENVDLAAFNLTQLVMMDLGTISPDVPLVMTLDADTTQAVIYPASFTIWGRPAPKGLDPEAMATVEGVLRSIEETFKMNKHAVEWCAHIRGALAKTSAFRTVADCVEVGGLRLPTAAVKPVLASLRLIREHELAVEDPELTALMDKLAPLL